MPAEMIQAVHVLDRSCGPEAILEAVLLAGRDDRVVSIGTLRAPPLPAQLAGECPSVMSISPVQLQCHGEALLKHLAAGTAVYHFWSIAAAAKFDDALVDRSRPIVARLPRAPVAGEIRRLLELVNVRHVALAFPLESAAADLRRADIHADIHVIPPPAAALGADDGQRMTLRKQLGIAPEEIVIAAPGEVHPRSGHRFAVWATAILAVAEWPVRLIFQHTGQHAREVAAFAREAGFARQTVLAGKSLPEVLAAADLAVLLGQDFLASLPAAGAMAADLPIVASDTADAREWLTDGENALLVPPGQPLAIGQALMRLIEDEALADRLAGASRSWAEQCFELGAVRRRWQALYAGLPSGRGHPRPLAAGDPAS